MDRERIVQLDKQHVWHPYTPMTDYLQGTDPLVIASARGSVLHDVNGRTYIDGNASWWTSLLGHQHPRLVQALQRQASTLCHTAFGGMTHEPAARLAERLVSVAPAGLSRVFFVDNGSTAVEAAIKLSVQFWAQAGRPQKRRFLALENAFHGDTLGAAALGGVAAFRAPFAPILMDVEHLPSPAQDLGRALESLERSLRAGADGIAALVIEPMVQGAAGMAIYAAEYLTKARELTQRHEVLLVSDEVFTGFGRTGPFWAAEHANITPDILCTAKGLSGGILPFGAVLVTPHVFDGFLGGPERAFYYGHTFAGNPLGAAVALEVFEVYRDEAILERARPKARRIAAAFSALANLPNVSRSRSLGMIGALELAGSSGYLERAGWNVYRRALEHGAYIRPLGNVVYVTPSLNIPDADLDRLLEIVELAVRESALEP